MYNEYEEKANNANTYINQASSLIDDTNTKYVKKIFNALYLQYEKDSMKTKTCDCYALLEDNLNSIKNNINSEKSSILSAAISLDNINREKEKQKNETEKGNKI